jgi:hypothetical protein
MPSQPDLFQEFRTAAEPHPVFCHQDFLQKIEDNRKSVVGKRAALLLERLVVDPRREFYKSTLGVNKGWRRSRLGGHGGSHFYAWWAPKGAPPLRDIADFETVPDGSVFLRDIRHHDDHSELTPQALAENYLPISPREIRREEYSPSPLTSAQHQFTVGRNRVRIIKGWPGSGKTTALWHAADQNSQRSTLYVTYSKDLAALARTHFERFASADKRFHVVTFPRLVRELCGLDPAAPPESEGRDAFLKELGSLPPRVLGPWVDDRKALYDEIHANLIGAALPVAAGRFPACDKPRLPDRTYREQRRKFIGGAAADVVIDVVNTIARRQPEFHELFFPELLLAWKAVQRLLLPQQGGIASGLLNFDCVAVDEVQDLTPIEAMVIAQLSRPTRDRSGAVTLLAAGDEAQTVRPTDFEWGWFHDMLHHVVGSPQEFRLGANLRSPRRIARLINSIWGLYGVIAKQDRPSGAREAEIEDEASDQLLYCAASPGPELQQLLRTFADREGLAIITLNDRPPAYVPPELQARILTVSEAKGLDFQAVCILDAGARLNRIVETRDRTRSNTDVEPLSRRLAIDQLRVAVSRPTERIYFLDVETSARGRDQLLNYLKWADEDNHVAPAIPATVLKTLEEELLDSEERVRLCEADARQFLNVKPEIAWARAKQAVALLGPYGENGAVADQTVRDSAHLTLTQVSFSLAVRGTRLAAELGQPDLFQEALDGARMAARLSLYTAINAVQTLQSTFRAEVLFTLMKAMASAPQQFEPWFAMEISSGATGILEHVEECAANPLTAATMIDVLPDVYKLFGVVDAEERIHAHRQKAVRALFEAKMYGPALHIIEQDPASPPSLRADCYELMGRHAEAAELFRGLGKLKEALRNYRSIPDFDKALELMEEIGGEAAAAESLEWVQDLRKVLKKRPQNLLRVATAAEKKYLNALFEEQLDGPRVKKAAVKRKVVRKTAAKAPGKRT